MKASAHSLHIRRVAIAILSYFREHPMAKDSAAGIAKFWIGESDEIVNEALTLLIQEGVIEIKGSIFQLIRSAGAITKDELVEKILRRLN